MSNSNEQVNENMTLDEIEEKLEQLNQIRIKIIQRDKSTVIEQIKVQMQLYGITVEDLKIFETKEPQVDTEKSALQLENDEIKQKLAELISNEKLLKAANNELLSQIYFLQQIPKVKQKTKKQIIQKEIPVLMLSYITPTSLFAYDSMGATVNFDIINLATVTYIGTKIQPGHSSQFTVDRFYCTKKNAQELHIDVHPTTVSAFMEVVRHIYISQGNDGNIVKQIKPPVFNAFARPVAGKQFSDNFNSSGNIPSFSSGLRTTLPYSMPFMPPASDQQSSDYKAQIKFSDLTVLANPVETIIGETDFYFYLLNPVNKTNLLVSSLENKPFEIIKDLEIYTEISTSKIYKQLGPYNQFLIQDGCFFICKIKQQAKFILVKVSRADKQTFLNTVTSQTS